MPVTHRHPSNCFPLQTLVVPCVPALSVVMCAEAVVGNWVHIGRIKSHDGAVSSLAFHQRSETLCTTAVICRRWISIISATPSHPPIHSCISFNHDHLQTPATLITFLCLRESGAQSLVSIAADRRLVEYDLTESTIESGVVLKEVAPPATLTPPPLTLQNALAHTVSSLSAHTVSCPLIRTTTGGADGGG